MIENLAFSGGSIRGIAYIGVLRYLEEHDMIDAIVNFSGTSIGACMAFCVVMGYTSAELVDIFTCIDIDKFRDISCDNVLAFFDTYGFDSGNKIIKMLEVMLKNKNYSLDITFSALSEATGKKLTIVGTCLNNMCAEYFSEVTTPDMEVLTAIRITFSIPVMYQPVKYNDKYYVDGAVTDNYPIDLFEDDNTKTIGFVLISKSIYTCEIDNIENYLLSVVWTSFAHQLKDKIDRYRDISIEIDSAIDSFDFNIDKNQRLELIETGYVACEKQMRQKYSHLDHLLDPQD